MSRWFRHYAGMMRDEKLVRVSIKTKQTIERVIWIWGAILESAAEIDDHGKYDVDAAEIAYFLRADEADILAVLGALAEAGRLADGAVVKWGDRQFSSDRSNARVAAYRERKRSKGSDCNDSSDSGNDDVTLPERHGNSPETETELEKERTPLPPKGAAVPDWVPADAWVGFLDMRRRLKKPMTERAKVLAFGELEKLREAGHDPAAVLNQSVLKSWAGLFPVDRAANQRAGPVPVVGI